MKIVINTCYGGFCPSAKAIMRWAELSGIEMHAVVQTDRDYEEPAHYKEIKPRESEDEFMGFISFCTKSLNKDGTMDEDSSWYLGEIESERSFRSDPNFVQAVEELGEDANTTESKLKVVEIPDDVNWTIEEYDGVEWIAEVHRNWC